MFNLEGVNAVIATLAAISAILIPWFIYRRGGKAIKISEQSGIASSNTEGIAQAFEGLKKTIDSMSVYITILENDRKVSKEDIRILTVQRDVLQKELNRMYRKYGDNGLPNGIFKQGSK